MLSLLNLLISLTPVVVVVLGLVLIAVRHQRLFLALFMLLTALESTRDFAPSLKMTFSGISVYPEDLVLVVCTLAALKSLKVWHLHRFTRASTFVLGVLTGIGVITWILTSGIQVGTNFWRAPMLTVALVMYATTRSRAWTWEDLRVVIVRPAILVALVSMAGIILYGAGSSSSIVEVGGIIEGGRPVSASGSLMMLVGLWVTALYFGKWSASRMLTLVILGSMVLLTQNRSVWLAALFGVVVWWLVPRFRLRTASGALGGLSRSLVALFVAMTTAVAGISVAALGQSATDDHTWLWRLAQWSASMKIPRSWFQWLAGSTFGPTPVSTPTDVAGLFKVVTHSQYVNTVENTGFIGLVVTLSLVIALGRTYFPPSAEPLGLVLCFTFLSFGVAYTLPPWAWLVTGLLLATAQNEPIWRSLNVSCDTKTDLKGSATPRVHATQATRS